MPRVRFAGLALSAALLAPLGLPAAEQRGPVIIPRDRSDPSIHEGFSGRRSAGYRQVTPLIGLLPASYEWFGGLLRAIGSVFQPQMIDPTYLGYQSGQQPFFFSRRGNVNRLYAGAKGIGGKNVTDTSRLGTPGGPNPGDPYWVGFPRPGNVEIPPPFQAFHANWDCFCRYDEDVACPTGAPPPLGVSVFVPGPNLHRFYGGVAGFISCHQCFGAHNIRKHDKFVGRAQGPHFGYPTMPQDSGYQECLRQSVESFAASGPGGQPRVPHLYGL